MDFAYVHGARNRDIDISKTAKTLWAICQRQELTSCASWQVAEIPSFTGFTTSQVVGLGISEPSTI